MNSFKTKAGTELPMLNLKGKPYLQVAHRIVWFREEQPEGSITTEVIQLGDSHAVMRASIFDKAGKLLATGTKAETSAGFPDFIEKAETGAIGRALALCGYGTQFAPELDEGERLADSPTTPAKKAKEPFFPKTSPKPAATETKSTEAPVASSEPKAEAAPVTASAKSGAFKKPGSASAAPSNNFKPGAWK